MIQYKQSVKVFDTFFKNPGKIIELGDSLEFYNDEQWPGRRTRNLLEINNTVAIEFAKFFAKQIADKVFYGLSGFEIDIRFHKNDIYDHTEANNGWIHNDEIDFAGLVYLNIEDPSMHTGTSIFDKTSSSKFKVQDYDSRKQLNLKKTVTDQYLKDLKENRQQFAETVNVGNKFNRLVAYDASQWHRPNNYEVKTLPRYSLLFFINNAKFTNLDSLLSISADWSDE
jgi:hypothetical protein|tara:strand:+ start:173 stop:850 length:678 start_codon:yes stop_codon:yes gene_type:complete